VRSKALAARHASEVTGKVSARRSRMSFPAYFARSAPRGAARGRQELHQIDYQHAIPLANLASSLHWCPKTLTATPGGAADSCNTIWVGSVSLGTSNIK
jgi:hypothetical protein